MRGMVKVAGYGNCGGRSGDGRQLGRAMTFDAGDHGGAMGAAGAGEVPSSCGAFEADLRRRLCARRSSTGH